MNRTALLSFFSLLVPLAAQDEDLTKRRVAKLRECLDKMVAAPQMSYTTSLQMKDMMMMMRLQLSGRQAKVPPPTKTSGVLANDVLYQRCHDGKDEVLVRGRRRLARSGGAWQLASQRLGSGNPAPFLLDPQRFFLALAAADLQLAHHSVGMIENTPVEIYTLRFEGEAAQALGLAGAYPDGVNSVARQATMVMAPVAARAVAIAPNRAAGNRNNPAVAIDLALFVSPGQRTVLKAKLRAYKDIPNAARIKQLLAARGGQQGVEEEEEVEEGAPAKPLVYKDGLPVRKVDDKAITSFDVDFTVGGEGKLPELDATAKRLLGIQ